MREWAMWLLGEHPNRRNSQCKGPTTGELIVFFRNYKETSVAGEEGGREKVKGDGCEGQII